MIYIYCIIINTYITFYNLQAKLKEQNECIHDNEISHTRQVLLLDYWSTVQCLLIIIKDPKLMTKKQLKKCKYVIKMMFKITNTGLK